MEFDAVHYMNRKSDEVSGRFLKSRGAFGVLPVSPSGSKFPPADDRQLNSHTRPGQTHPPLLPPFLVPSLPFPPGEPLEEVFEARAITRSNFLGGIKEEVAVDKIIPWLECR